MNKLIPLIIICMLSSIMRSDSIVPSIPSETEPLVSAIEKATGWTCDELIAGLSRLDRLYQLEMQTKEGRARWHGKVKQTLVFTNNLVKLEIYDDGWTNQTPFRLVTPTDNNHKLSHVALTNGIPLTLAKARLRRITDKQVIETNVVRTVNSFTIQH